MLAENFKNIQEKLALACQKVGRDPASVSLLPVSKTFPPEVIAEAAALGYRRFGENKAQEMKQKAEVLHDLHLSWVIIGHLQTNKAKEVAKYADEIQSLDRIDLAVALDKRLQKEGRAIDALIQIKSSTEETKTGMLAEEVPAFLQSLKTFDTLRIKGFMTIAENSPDPEVVRCCFRGVSQLAEKMRQQTGMALPVLSMGMSGDFELAIAEGATEVRIGSAIFGARHYSVTT
ncbi:YggS family pyridoxal phosphate-dependent enzyme [Pelistega europaea]|uniref:Pyridoxal phosphate homeostasis protein n=1 Tax=Pelistega europaea TaxID=106147 RepID=A0A7Y4L845_9BURK|nr:YggS family pyridoxal phosphate-dependent enzyme [Pelistega europaea]NOL48699.1 YggS family pyridoxal phosphate-dependent enzyme [Pelistega europaea]